MVERMAGLKDEQKAGQWVCHLAASKARKMVGQKDVEWAEHLVAPSAVTMAA